MHAAIRLLLPLIPAFAASSPYLDGRNTGYKDARIETYRHNQEKIPSITGKVIPEAVYTEADYNEKIFEVVKRDIAPYDTDHLLNHFFLNSRGAIARFDRGAVEIRLVDIQECPKADVALAEFEMAILKGLAKGTFAPLEKQKAFDTDRLVKILFATVKDAEEALIQDSEYLKIFGIEASEMGAKDLLKSILEKVRSDISAESLNVLQKLLDRGTLATVLVKKLGEKPSQEAFMQEYEKLARSLATNTLYE